MATLMSRREMSSSLGPHRRVLHVVPRLGLGGAEILAVHLACASHSNSYQVAMASLSDEVEEALLRQLGERGIPVWTLGKRPGPDPRAARRLRAVLQRFDPDILHTHLYVLSYVFAASVGLRTRTVVHTIHNVAEKEATRIGKLIQGIAFRSGVKPVAISDEVLASMDRVYGLKECPLIPNGIPVASYRPGPDARPAWRGREGFAPDDVLIACVALLRPQKNHALLIRAFSTVARRWPRARLVLVGDGPERGKLHDLAERLCPAGAVRFLGNRTDVPQVLAASDVFVLSSDWEGNPLSVMEAMASGLPVVCTAVGGVPELVADGVSGFLVPAGDQETLADRLERLIADPELRRSMGRRGACEADLRFDLPAMARAYAQLYRAASR